MGLHWIVPGLRATVSKTKLSHADAVKAWVAELRVSRSALLRWYSQLEGPKLDEAIAQVESWRSTKFFGPQVATRNAAVRLSSGHDASTDATVAQTGFCPRIWYGPLRVLLAEQAVQGKNAQQADAAPAPPSSRTELEHLGAVILVESPSHEVLNSNAELLPGDVVEFPLFRVLQYAGVPGFAGATFRPEGSFLLGTAVELPQGGLLHDNLVAMRFQLLHNAARGAYYSFDPVFTPESTAGKSCNRGSFGAQRTVWARGLMYAACLLAPNKRDDRYLIQLSNWCSQPKEFKRTHAPNAAAMALLPNNMPITPGWTCVSATLATFYIMLDQKKKGWAPAGGMGDQARIPHDTEHIVTKTTSKYYHFDPKYNGGARLRDKQARIDAAKIQVEAHGGDFGELTPGLNASLGSRAFEKYMRPAMDWMQDVGLNALLGPSSIAPRDAGDDIEPILPCNEDDQELRNEQSSHERCPIAAQWQVYGRGEPAQVNLDRMRDLCGAMTWFSLNGHEYGYIKIHPHNNMRDELAVKRGPPCVGDLAAYNPVTGEPYVSEPKGTLYVMEAAGSLLNNDWIAKAGKAMDPNKPKGRKEGSRWHSKMTDSRPAKWAQVHSVWVQRSGNAKVVLGEQTKSSRASLSKVRTKTLESIAVTSAKSVRAAFDHPTREGFVPLVLDSRTGKARDPHTYYAHRAVPFETMLEAADIPANDTHENTWREIRRKKKVLSELIDISAPYALTPKGHDFISAHVLNQKKLDKSALRYDAALTTRKRALERKIPADKRKLEKQDAVLDKLRAKNAELKQHVTQTGTAVPPSVVQGLAPSRSERRAARGGANSKDSPQSEQARQSSSSSLIQTARSSQNPTRQACEGDRARRNRTREHPRQAQGPPCLLGTGATRGFSPQPPAGAARVRHQHSRT